MRRQAIPHATWALVNGGRIRVRHNAGHVLEIEVDGNGGFLTDGSHDADWQVQPSVRRPEWIDHYPDPRVPVDASRWLDHLAASAAMMMLTAALVLGAVLLVAGGDVAGGAWMLGSGGVAALSLSYTLRRKTEPSRDEQKEST